MERIQLINQIINDNQHKTKVCLVSGSNGTHMNAAIFGCNPKFEVKIFTRRPEIFGTEILGVRNKSPQTWLGKILLASADPKEACSDCSIFIISSPVNVQESLLRQMQPHLPHGAIVGSVFGQGNFELVAKYVLGDDIQVKNLTIFSLFNIPYTCLTIEPGKKVMLMAMKEYTRPCCTPKNRIQDVKILCEQLWEMPCKPLNNFLEIILTPGNQIIHPGRVMGVYGNNNIYLMDEQPLFYESMDQTSADNIEKLSNEIQLIKHAILARFPEICLDSVIPIGERICNQYGDSVLDKSSLRTIFATNKGYNNFKVPCKKVGDKFIVNVEARIFTEDIPFGLCILKDISEMLELEVPNITRAIEWHQKLMNKEFIIDGKINEAEIESTGVPRRFGFRTIEDFIGYYSI